MSANEIYNIVTQIIAGTKDILVGGTGGLMMYFVENKRMRDKGMEAKLDIGQMFINIFIGSFVAYVIGSSIAPDTMYRDGIVAVIGMCSYSIVGLLESRFTQWIVGIFMAFVGEGKNDGKK